MASPKLEKNIKEVENVSDYDIWIKQVHLNSALSLWIFTCVLQIGSFNQIMHKKDQWISIRNTENKTMLLC